MATLTATFQSKELMRKVSFSAIIPTSTKSLYDPESTEEKDKYPLKTLFLLHGWDGNHEDWIQNTRIVELSTKYQIAIILPSGENSFYVDHPNHNNYGKFISEELVREVRRLFPLSEDRENTWIAGLSMGGYGALRNGLTYSETFGKIAAFSSRLFTKDDPYHDLKEDNPINYRIRAIIDSNSFEDLPKDMDLYEIVKKANFNPELFLACGTEDHLYEENWAFHRYLEDSGIEHEYIESAGEHNWNFWSTYIEKAIQWMIKD